MKRKPKSKKRARKSSLESQITIFENGRLAIVNLSSELLDLALKLNPGDQRLRRRKKVRDRSLKDRDRDRSRP